MKKILILFGTRPEAIKLLPLAEALKKDGRFQIEIGSTGQHKEMLAQVFKVFDQFPDFDLEAMEPAQSLTLLSSRLLEKLAKILTQKRPDLVIVQGDTTSTFIASLAAFYQKIPVAHVEAGLRTHNKSAPFPEEINRRLTSELADLHFAPTQRAKQNLIDSQIEPKRIFVTGNTGIDALLSVKTKIEGNPSLIDPEIKKILEQNKMTLITLHRRENFGPPHIAALNAISKIAKEFTHKIFLFPMHPNPLIRLEVEKHLSHQPNIYLVEPLDYPSLVAVLNQSELIVTDSGGLQEEAPSFQIPVLVLRECTERTEAVEQGFSRLVGTDPKKIEQEMRSALSSNRWQMRLKDLPNPYGDGAASAKIVDHLKQTESDLW